MFVRLSPLPRVALTTGLAVLAALGVCGPASAGATVPAGLDGPISARNSRGFDVHSSPWQRWGILERTTGVNIDCRIADGGIYHDQVWYRTSRGYGSTGQRGWVDSQDVALVDPSGYVLPHCPRIGLVNDPESPPGAPRREIPRP